MTVFSPPTVLDATVVEDTSLSALSLAPAAGAAPGDVLVAAVAWPTESFTLGDVPAGWGSLEVAHGTVDRHLLVVWKVLTQADIDTPGSVPFTDPGSIAFNYRASATIQGVSNWEEAFGDLASGEGVTTSSVELGAVEVTPTGRNALLLAVYWTSTGAFSAGVFACGAGVDDEIAATREASSLGGIAVYSGSRFGVDRGDVTFAPTLTTSESRNWLGFVLEVVGMRTPPLRPVGTFRPSRVYEDPRERVGYRRRSA